MLTVIIAPDEYIDIIKQNKLFLSILSASKDMVFCKCNYEGTTLDEMIPDLYNEIVSHDRWRAIVVGPDNRYHINPFDYTEYKEIKNNASEVDWEFLKERRNLRFDSYEKAIANPLTKLLYALIGEPYSKLLISKEDYECIVDESLMEYEYMLRKRLESMNTSKLAFQINVLEPNSTEDIDGDVSYGKVLRKETEKADLLLNLVTKEDYPKLLQSIIDRDSSEIIKMIGVENVLKFNRIIGGYDPEYIDPEFVESQLFNFKKHEMFVDVVDDFKLNYKRPDDVICVSLRTSDMVTYRDNIKTNFRQEPLYSRFADYNMYPSKTRFMVYDILDIEDKRYHKEFIKFLATLLILAGNKMPTSVLNGGNLYYIDAEFDDQAIVSLCDSYIGKLWATHTEINKKILEVSQERKINIDDKDAMELFEKEIEVPVYMRSSVENDDMLIKQKVGLSKDCPQDEEKVWHKRKQEVDKHFVRYFREPRRAVKATTKGLFRSMNSIKDDRILGLSEYQLENVQFELEEEEKKMVETYTEPIFNTDTYKKEIDEAEKEIQKEMNKRMLRKSTILTGLIGLLIYFLGFGQFFIDNIGSMSAVLYVLKVALGAMVVFALFGVVVLFYYRYRLKVKIDNYNALINDIKTRIGISISQFSTYLSHAANVMRKYSVLNYGKKPGEDKLKALKKHKADIERKIMYTKKTYAAYVDDEKYVTDNIEPYKYDFTVLKEYDYPTTEVDMDKSIFYVHSGYTIKVPVNYVNKILIIKEDIYD